MSSKVKSPKTRGHGKASIVETRKKPQNLFKVLPEMICENILKTNNLGEIEEFLITNLKIEVPDTDLKCALLVDFYLTLVIWMKERFHLDTVKFSAVFSAAYYLMENVRSRQMDFLCNVEEMKKLLLRKEEIAEDSFEGLLGELDEKEIQAVQDFIFSGIFQHHKLFEYVFSYHRAQGIIGTDLIIETLPLVSAPYPAPLCEAIDEHLYDECFAADGSVRSMSAKSGLYDDDCLERDLDGLEKQMEEFSEFAGLSVTTIAMVLRQECDAVFTPASSEMRERIEDIEMSFLKRINKLPKA